MPYYSWQGVTLDGALCKGTLFAHNEQALDAMLFKQDIALIDYKQKKQIHLLPISQMSKLLFFEHLQALLDAGIHLFQALTIISQQTSDVRFADTIYQMSHAIEEGKPLHEALAQYPLIFDQEMVHITHIGMQAGNISVALQALCYYLHQVNQFNKKVRRALLLPLFTFAMFLFILLMILLFIVPRYVDLFVSMHKDLPAATQMLVKLHTFIRSYYLVGSLSILAALLCIVIRWKYSLATKKWSDRLLLRLPWVGSLLEKVYVVQFLQSLALLLQGGIALVPALEITHRSMRNLYVKDQIDNMLKRVQNGQSLGDAMQSSQPSFFAQDLILLTIVGEQSASVSMMMQRAAQIYQKQIEQKIAKYTIILQPLLMIILGLLVATLIFAVYMPLFNLAESI